MATSQAPFFAHIGRLMVSMAGTAIDLAGTGPKPSDCIRIQDFVDVDIASALLNPATPHMLSVISGPYCTPQLNQCIALILTCLRNNSELRTLNRLIAAPDIFGSAPYYSVIADFLTALNRDGTLLPAVAFQANSSSEFDDDPILASIIAGKNSLQAQIQQAAASARAIDSGMVLASQRLSDLWLDLATSSGSNPFGHLAARQACKDVLAAIKRSGFIQDFQPGKIVLVSPQYPQAAAA